MVAKLIKSIFTTLPPSPSKSRTTVVFPPSSPLVCLTVQMWRSKNMAKWSRRASPTLWFPRIRIGKVAYHPKRGLGLAFNFLLLALPASSVRSLRQLESLTNPLSLSFFSCFLLYSFSTFYFEARANHLTLTSIIYLEDLNVAKAPIRCGTSYIAWVT